LSRSSPGWPARNSRMNRIKGCLKTSSTLREGASVNGTSIRCISTSHEMWRI
jgi:hypothetical protein